MNADSWTRQGEVHPAQGQQAGPPLLGRPVGDDEHRCWLLGVQLGDDVGQHSPGRVDPHVVVLPVEREPIQTKSVGIVEPGGVARADVRLRASKRVEGRFEVHDALGLGKEARSGSSVRVSCESVALHLLRLYIYLTFETLGSVWG